MWAAIQAAWNWIWGEVGKRIQSQPAPQPPPAQVADFQALSVLAGTQLQRLLDEVAAERKRSDELAKRLDEAEAKRDRAEQAGAEARTVLRGEMDALRDELRDCRDKHAASEARARGLEAKREALAGEVRSLRSQVAGLKLQNAAQQQEINALKKAAQGSQAAQAGQ